MSEQPQRRLTIIRHAKSSWANPNQPDFERPLNSRGQRDAPVMAQRLVQHGITPDHLIASPARRAYDTATLMASEFDYPVDTIVQDKRIYEASLTELLGVIHGLENTYREVLMFGHNPGMLGLANYLTPAAIDEMPTCAMVCAAFSFASWAEVTEYSGELIFHDYPKNT